MTLEAAGQPTTPPEGEGQRLAKAVAALLPCSRREAEQYVAEGWVRVDGECVRTPQQRVAPGQRIEVDRQAPVPSRLQPVLPATLLLHKPAGLTTAAALALLAEAARWPGDASGIRFSTAHLRGLQALLPLPAPASGLCVFSQSPGVLRKLTEDAAFIEQELVAEVQGPIAPGGLARLRHGLAWAGRPLPPAHVSWQNETRLRFAMKGIAPERVEWMCAQVGLRLQALRRIRIGRVPMAGLPAGQWRHLAAGERF
ncbi:RNA pseudouridine synthase [Ottowia sp.]|uniref:RNA pseudouridine synthase n=1 Tax=Ottowia sp. TaxID=1898956 RepID=UPI0039E57D7B